MAQARDVNATNRRKFLKYMSAAGLAGLFLPRSLRAGGTLAKSRVVIVTNAKATTGNTINTTMVRQMVAEGVRSIGGLQDEGAVWKSLMTGVSASSKIGIKINCNNSAIPTHPAVVNAVIDSLKQMSFSGTAFPENNIIVYDMSSGSLQNGGYVPNNTSTGVRYMGARDVGMSTTTYDCAGVQQHITALITDTLDYLINIAVLKDHGAAGVTLCLKNHYGSSQNPELMHGNGCFPYPAALNSAAPIKQKQVLNMIDALYGVRSGGPEGVPQFTANTILMSRDIVAVDYQGRKLLAENGWTSGNTAAYIDAACTTYGLGTNDPNNMEIVRLTGVTGANGSGAGKPSGMQLHQNYPNPFNPVTNIAFEVDRARHVAIEVVDMTGRVVSVLLDREMPAGEYTVPFSGHGLASGAYVCALRSEGVQLAKTMMLLG